MKTLTEKKENRAAYCFILPWLVGFVLLIAGPTIVTVILGFTRYDIFRPPKWVGLKNFIRMFTDDEVFAKSIYNTFYYTLFNVPIGVFGSLLLAFLLNNNLPGMNYIKTALYVPTIISGIAMAMLWMWIFDPNSGMINTLLRNMGCASPPLWFKDPDTVKLTMILVKVVEIGGTRMIIFLAGLQNIPKVYYEVAYIDGANFWKRFREVTVPLLSPIILLNLVVAVIDSFKVFINAYAITDGGPLNESMFLVLYIYKNAFKSIKMGYASAISTVFIVFILILTVIHLKASKEWVYYAE